VRVAPPFARHRCRCCRRRCCRRRCGRAGYGRPRCRRPRCRGCRPGRGARTCGLPAPTGHAAEGLRAEVADRSARVRAAAFRAVIRGRYPYYDVVRLRADIGPG